MGTWASRVNCLFTHTLTSPHPLGLPSPGALVSNIVTAVYCNVLADVYYQGVGSLNIRGRRFLLKATIMGI